MTKLTEFFLCPQTWSTAPPCLSTEPRLPWRSSTCHPTWSVPAHTHRYTLRDPGIHTLTHISTEVYTHKALENLIPNSGIPDVCTQTVNIYCVTIVVRCRLYLVVSFTGNSLSVDLPNLLLGNNLTCDGTVFPWSLGLSRQRRKTTCLVLWYI